MSSKRNDKADTMRCSLAIAKYWGLCSETVMYAILAIRRNPKLSDYEAMNIGFAKAKLALLPPELELAK